MSGKVATVLGVVLFFLASPVCGGPPAPPPDLLKARLAAARKAYELNWERSLLHAKSATTVESLYQWSRRWLEAERALGAKKAEQRQAAQAHFVRMRKLEERVKQMVKVEPGSRAELAAAEFYRIEAEIFLSQVPRK